MLALALILFIVWLVLAIAGATIHGLLHLLLVIALVAIIYDLLVKPGRNDRLR